MKCPKCGIEDFTTQQQLLLWPGLLRREFEVIYPELACVGAHARRRVRAPTRTRVEGGRA